MQCSLFYRSVAEMKTGCHFLGSASSLIRSRAPRQASWGFLTSSTPIVYNPVRRNHCGSTTFSSFLLFPHSLISPSFASPVRQKSTTAITTEDDATVMQKGGAVEASDETHPDFQPRAITTDFSDDEINMIKKDIRETINEEKVVIFIKGVPEAPMCAFSKKLVDVVECLGLGYTSFDVLAHPVVRSYVKEVSEWPTIPQLFVMGEFVGGLDIVLKMAQEGDLQLLLDSKGIEHRDQTKKEN